MVVTIKHPRYTARMLRHSVQKLILPRSLLCSIKHFDSKKDTILFWRLTSDRHSGPIVAELFGWKYLVIVIAIKISVFLVAATIIH